MKTLSTFVVILGVACLSGFHVEQAHADSYQEEAQTRCDPGEKTFVIRPFLFGEDVVTPDKGYTRVSASGDIHCLIGTIDIKARIQISAGDVYHCAGGGNSFLKELSASGKALIRKDLEIGSARLECLSVETGVFDRLESLSVHVSPSNVSVKTCLKLRKMEDEQSVTCNSEHLAVAGAQ
jgi:hypothetical protein